MAAISRAKKVFQDSNSVSLSIASSWNKAKDGSNMKSVKCQTSPEIYQFKEMETQTGLHTAIMQDQVVDQNKGITLLEHYCKLHRERSEQEWTASILEGNVTVDCEVATDPDTKVDTEFFLEYVNEHVSMGTQTEPLHQRDESGKEKGTSKTASKPNARDRKSKKKSSAGESKRNRGEGKAAGDEYADDYEDDDDDGGKRDDDQEDGQDDDDDDDEEEEAFTEEKKSDRLDSDNPVKLMRFLRTAEPMVMEELGSTDQTRAFDLINQQSSLAAGAAAAADGSENTTGGASYYNMLSVDLEKKKVVFPDWTKARHFKGVITRRTITRNKERIYDIEYDDGSVLTGVREEYIRLLGDPSTGTGNSSSSSGTHRKGAGDRRSSVSSAPIHMLLEGVRVHARVSSKSGMVRYLPGRITKRTPAGKSGYAFDVECEGSRIEVGLTSEDLFIGLNTGQTVEARRPSKVNLQCTGIAWNSTGNSIAASYGRTDMLGWCDFPGAVCCWNIFSRSLIPDSPDYVLDHPSCLMCVSYHPHIPSLVAAGSFNGEVIVWDLTNAEQPLAVSLISDYSHKEPVLDVQWVYYPLKLAALKQQAYAAAGSRMAAGSFGSRGPGGTNASSAAAVRAAADGWLLSSVGADGKVLFWSIENGFKYPVKGVTLAKSSRSSSSRRHYPMSHGGTIASFGGGGIGGGNTGRNSSTAIGSKPTWVLVGQEGGSIVRSQVARLLSGSILTDESYRSLPQTEEVFPSIKRGGNADSAGPVPHIGTVTGLQFSPFHRNLFLSAGVDGAVRLFHMLERKPIREWEPRPPPSAAGVSTGTVFAPLCAVRFSPTRPLVFATASSEGFLYVYDLSRSDQAAPAAVLECPFEPPIVRTAAAGSAAASAADGGDEHSPGGRAGGSNSAAAGSPAGDTYGQKHRKNNNKHNRKRGGGDSAHNRVSITDISFNPKQRGMIAACDSLGRVHLWMLPWRMSNVGADEQRMLNQLASLTEGAAAAVDAPPAPPTQATAAATAGGDGGGVQDATSTGQSRRSQKAAAAGGGGVDDNYNDTNEEGDDERRHRRRREERRQRRARDGAGYELEGDA